VTCPVLTGPNNYQIWKIRISIELHKQKVLGMVTGVYACPTGGKPTSKEVRKWQEHDEKAHSIIQKYISDTILLKTQQHTESKVLFEAIIKLFKSLNLPSASICTENSYHPNGTDSLILLEFIATL
jgi:hypothetical protein